MTLKSELGLPKGVEPGSLADKALLKNLLNIKQNNKV